MAFLPTLDVILAMCFIYAIFSALVSALREWLESHCKSRALHLARGIGLLVGQDNVNVFYNSPIVDALYPDSVDKARKEVEHALLSSADYRGSVQQLLGNFRRTGIELPSYIPSRVFAQAMLQRLREEVKAPPGSTFDLQQLRNWIAAIDLNDRRWSAIHAALIGAQSVDEVTEKLAQWYDSAMERVTGWYKRETQKVLFVIGLVVAIAGNVDSVRLVRYFIANPEAASAVANEAVKKNPAAGQSAPAQGNGADAANPHTGGVNKDALTEKVGMIHNLGAPIGWSASAVPNCSDWMLRLLGWILSGLAFSLGAPFWFDILNRVALLRSSIRPEQETPDKSTTPR